MFFLASLQGVEGGGRERGGGELEQQELKKRRKQRRYLRRIGIGRAKRATVKNQVSVTRTELQLNFE
jgi:hypothetical protein